MFWIPQRPSTGNEVQGGKAEASRPQDRTGGARSVKLLGPRPTGPSSTGRRSCLNGGVTQRKVSAGCVPRSGRWEPAPRAACPPPRFLCVTALRRGAARPAGWQRGRLWHTTGADLRGRTRGLALRTGHSPRYSHMDRGRNRMLGSQLEL